MRQPVDSLENRTMNDRTDQLPSRAPFSDSPLALLNDEKRRRAVAILSGREMAVSLSELASAVASRDRGADGEPATVEEISITLHHNHLPRLDDANVVDYDARTHTVFPIRVDEVAAVLEPSEERETDA